jgi:hypothetical protein
MSTKRRDYRQGMKYSNYRKWLEHTLNLNLPSNSVTIYNASYHNVQLDPATISASTKVEENVAVVMELPILDN